MGYRESPAREAALLNLLAVVPRHVRLRPHEHLRDPRAAGSFGPFRDFVAGGRHIHHFVPGIALAFLVRRRGAGHAATGELEPWLAIPFGAGVALTLDESALLLELEDVYWTEEGVLSLQITLGRVGRARARWRSAPYAAPRRGGGAQALSWPATRRRRRLLLRPDDLVARRGRRRSRATGTPA